MQEAFGHDFADDPQHVLADREIARVIIIAAKTGHRFGCEGRDKDPAAWMYAPRRLFSGARPVEACTTRCGFAAAMLLHGTWPDVDMEPEARVELLADTEDLPAVPLPQSALFTAKAVTKSTDETRHVFYVLVAVEVAKYATAW